ncbi:MAG: DNA polymerase III subunit gamma/tau [Lentisphaerae bacterium]|nr:DNA polymerase III subunit gamma/tau [Lentisphaerota bacterium]
MSSHQVIARKWRPQKFGDVVGQTHVIRTLRNAIACDRVGHAYLLVGPRGIGKTTIARIFAKAINCENPQDGEPCCQCNSCLALAGDSSLDVIEIDAASRNSVEHMRALSEEAYHMPVASKYKIYIIDEVHMLSKAAWNALLKTVEEPPSHVKFIFATTEAHLVLPTIVSRCQRFDLRPIPGNMILNRLKLIAESENVKIAPEALSAIARAAEGGMRDAQSSLEQMLAFFGGHDREIAAEQVLELFGLTNAVELDTLLAAMLQNQPGPVVTIINQLSSRGRNLETLFDDILEMLRGAELMHILNQVESVLDFDPEKLERCRKLAQLTTPDVLRSFMESLTPVGRILHEALNKAIFLEAILLKAMHEAHAPTIGDVLTRLNQLRSAGDLQFIDQVPGFQAQPKLTMPVVLPEIQKTEEVQTASAPEVAPVMEPAVEKIVENPAPAVTEKVAECVAGVKNVEPAAAAVEVPAQEMAASNAAEQTAVVENIEAVEAPVEAPAVNKVTAETVPSDMESLFKALVTAAGNAALDCPLQDCRPLEMVNSVLTVEVPSGAMENLRSNRMKLLMLLQQISGNWAILLDFKAADSLQSAPLSAAEESPAAEPAAAVAEAELESVEEVVDITAEAEEYTAAAVSETNSGTDNDVQSAEPPAADDYAAEEFIELNAEAGAYSGEDDISDYSYNKRSVINNPDEVAATAKLPPVQKVLDLFGGEIVDIHA